MGAVNVSYTRSGEVSLGLTYMTGTLVKLGQHLGGAIMQSIFGALLTAGYAAAVSSEIAASDKNITDSTQAALTKSFDSAEAVAEQHPQYADAIIAGAKQAIEIANGNEGQKPPPGFTSVASATGMPASISSLAGAYCPSFR